MIESSSIDAEGIGGTGDAADIEALPFPVRGRDVKDDPFRHDFIVTDLAALITVLHLPWVMQ